MPPRSTARTRGATQAARGSTQARPTAPRSSTQKRGRPLSQSSEAAQDPASGGLAPTQAARKSRRIARKTGEAGPSGWKHDLEGDERDLVPPSDVEEYEEWERTRRRGRRGAEQGGGSQGSAVQDTSSPALQSSYPSQSSLPLRSGRMLSEDDISDSQPSPTTSQTIPLTASQLREWDAEYGDVDEKSANTRARSRVEVTDGSESFDADDEEEEIVWPRLIDSGSEKMGSPRRKRRKGSAERPHSPRRYVQGENDERDAGVVPAEYEPPPSPTSSLVPDLSVYEDQADGMGLQDDDQPSRERMPSPIPDPTPRHGEMKRSAMPSQSVEGPDAPPALDPNKSSTAHATCNEVQAHRPRDEGEVVSVQLEAPDALQAENAISIDSEIPTRAEMLNAGVEDEDSFHLAEKRSDDALDPDVSPGAADGIISSGRFPSVRLLDDALDDQLTEPFDHGFTNEADVHSDAVMQPVTYPTDPVSPFQPVTHPLELTPVRRLPLTPLRSQPVGDKIPSPAFLFTPVKSVGLSQSFNVDPNPSQQSQSHSPLIEAQIGTNNQPQWRRVSPSPSRTPSRQPSVDVRDGRSRSPRSRSATPRTPTKSVAEAIPEQPEDSPSPASPLTPPPVEPVIPPEDPALQQFRGARTFRTRTVLQLQPYTKERQIYEAALKKGGLKKGKRAIARERDISSSEEDDEEEGQVGIPDSPSVADPEQIVIGNTPPTAEARQPRKPKELVDADYDAYFLQYGKAADDDDEEDEKRLQVIARARLKDEKEERRRQREAERTRRKFESLMRKGDGADHADKAGRPPPVTGKAPKTTQRPRPARASSDESPSPPRPARQPRPAKVTPGQPRTYSKKDRAQPGTARARINSPSVLPDSSSARSISRLETPDDIAMRAETIHVADAWTGDDFAHDPDHFGGGADFEMEDPATPTLPSASAQPRDGRHGEGSFFINDVRTPAATRQPRSAPSESESSDESAIAEDKRKKLARRMLPEAMLQRLEREAANRERQKEKRRQEARKIQSPAGPGRAIVRKGGGVNGDILGFVGSEPETEDEVEDDDRTPRAALRQRELIVVSDSDNASSSSQAIEDNAGAQSIAHLFDGDFETIIAGKRPKVRSEGKERRKQRKESSRARRPALGLAKRVHATSASKPKALFQARLDFPAEQRSPSERHQDRSSKKRKQPTKTTSKSLPRPAIRLDDHVIFSGADFAFDDDGASSVQSQPKKPRASAGRQSGKELGDDHVDAGIGKARSWANFENFPIDFGITPLPSGLYCSPTSFAGDQSLKRLVEVIQGVFSEDEPEAVSTYGVELRCDMSPAAITSVVPVLFDSIQNDLLGYANDTVSDPPVLSPIRFLGRYLTAKHGDGNGDMVFLRLAFEQAAVSLCDALDGLHDVNGGRKKEVRDILLLARLFGLELACRASGAASDGVEVSAVGSCAISLIRFLLSSGFDRTIRPLKKMLKGESDSPEVDDDSIVAWISVMRILDAWSEARARPHENFLACLDKAIDATFPSEETGPIASERIWFLVFGLCAISQFEASGKISALYQPRPRWQLVRRAISLIRISHKEEVEERAHIEQLRGRDRYIKAMIARCIKLSAVWQWSFDRESFSVATKDLGVIFKDRQHRNLPTEPPVDYPAFITHFDMTLTAAPETKRESAFELYLRLVCVAASDIIASAQTMAEAQKAEKDVQKLIMSIIPVSPVHFSRILPPTLRQVGQLINRYSTMVAACYFSPSLLPWLLANSRKWASFDKADFESRQVCIRGLMYLAVACRHHGQSLVKVVDVSAGILATLQKELDDVGKPSVPAQAPGKLEIERTMVLVVACFRQIIQHHTYDPEAQAKPAYPDPCLLHSSWTGRIFGLDLANDLKCGTEVIATIQAFLDARASALPRAARQRREARLRKIESQDSYSFGIDFSTIDLRALGGEAVSDDPAQKQDDEFAAIINTVISPSIYRLLSDMLPVFPDETMSEHTRTERQVFVGKLAKCWSDCAAVVVIEHDSPDGWTPYIGPLGKESWQRLRNEQGRLQVGLQFMLNVALSDPSCYDLHEDVFLPLFFQSIVTDKLTIEHKYLTALFAMPRVLDTPLFADVAELPCIKDTFDRTAFTERRPAILEAIFTAVPFVLGSTATSGSTKALVYRCLNLLVSAMAHNDESISNLRVLHKEIYHSFAVSTARDLLRLAGEYINVNSVPKLKVFVQ